MSDRGYQNALQTFFLGDLKLASTAVLRAFRVGPVYGVGCRVMVAQEGGAQVTCSVVFVRVWMLESSVSVVFAGLRCSKGREF